MSIREEVEAGVANSLGPVLENAVAQVRQGIRDDVVKEILSKLSNKEIIIKIPDLTKNA